MNWFEDQPLTDVQTAIQSQAIQTVLEQNTSRVTDSGFQSFLQNAPIPRCFYTTPTGAYGIALSPFTWSRVGAHDPYAMLDTATSTTFTIPVDGYYNVVLGVFGAGGAAGFVSGQINDTAAGTNLAVQLMNTPAAATGNYIFTVTYQGPMRAGFKINGAINNASSAVITFATAGTFMSFTWVAPYNTYTTGAGGN